jgi:hypothetical protein
MCGRAQAVAWVLAGFITATGCAGARADFLPAGRLDRLDATVLLAAPDGSWRRGSVGGQTPWYPASCVKLGFAIAGAPNGPTGDAVFARLLLDRLAPFDD